MSSGDRLNVVPNRMNLIVLKKRCKAAEKGHSLLKKRSKALYVVCRKQALDLKQILSGELDNCFKLSRFSIAEAKVSMGNFSVSQMLDVVHTNCSFHLHSVPVSSAGVNYRRYELRGTDTDEFK